MGIYVRRTQENKSILLQESASVAVSREPGIWVAEIVFLSYSALRKCRYLSKCITASSLVEFDLKMSTTAILSK